MAQPRQILDFRAATNYKNYGVCYKYISIFTFFLILYYSLK
nr:MAG TPA: hypothetical protein [Caudoviricetes sp.]